MDHIVLEAATDLSLILMGMTLGLVGAGGSMMTIPILVYLSGIPLILATGYSIIIVGCVSTVAAIRYRERIMIGRVLPFLIPSVLGVFIMRHFIIPCLPDMIAGIALERILFWLLLFCINLSGYMMITSSGVNQSPSVRISHRGSVALVAFSLGIFVSFLGVGGGFIITPTLVLWMGFSMQEAVPTSLLVMAVNSLAGFVANQDILKQIESFNLLEFLVAALLGMCIGISISKDIRGDQLKKPFLDILCGQLVWQFCQMNISSLIKHLTLYCYFLFNII